MKRPNSAGKRAVVFETKVTMCRNCPNYIEEECDVYHGCHTTPAMCRVTKCIILESGLVHEKCPLKEKTT